MNQRGDNPLDFTGDKDKRYYYKTTVCQYI